MPNANRHEVAGRVRKTQAILGAARVLHLTAAQVATDLDARAQLVNLADVIEPSNETWHQVVAAMIRDEATLAGYAAAAAARQPMPRRPASAGQFAEWASRGVAHDRVGASA